MQPASKHPIIHPAKSNHRTRNYAMLCGTLHAIKQSYNMFQKYVYKHQLHIHIYVYKYINVFKCMEILEYYGLAYYAVR